MACGCRKNQTVQQQQTAPQGTVLSQAVGAGFVPDGGVTTAAGVSEDKFKTNIALEPVIVPVGQSVSTQTNSVKNVPPEVLEKIKQQIRARKAANPQQTQQQQQQATVQSPVVREALENNLKSCYLCAKKHLVRAEIFFEEYHTGYPDHIKNLMESLQVSEQQVSKAFLLWQKIMGHLDMAANELLGNDANAETMNQEHVAVANEIRNERIKLSDNPLASPDFDNLIIKVHMLQHKALEK